MNNPLPTPRAQVRCCSCHRLLMMCDPGAIGAAIRIKCPRCKAVNLLRPDRAPTLERDTQRQSLRDPYETHPD